MVHTDNCTTGGQGPRGGYRGYRGMGRGCWLVDPGTGGVLSLGGVLGGYPKYMLARTVRLQVN